MGMYALNQVFRVVQDRRQEPEEEHEARCDVRLRPPRRRQWAPDIRYLRPVERDQGHAHPRSSTRRAG